MEIGEIENELTSLGEEIRQEQRKKAYLVRQIENYDMMNRTVDQLERILEICEEY